MIMLNEILETIKYFERNIGSKPVELIIDNQQFDCLLIDLSQRNISIRCSFGNDPYCGIILDDVKIGWSNEAYETW